MLIGDNFFVNLKQGGGGGGGGCALQFKVAMDQENIFNFLLCVNKV